MSAALDLLGDFGVEARAVGLTAAVREGLPVSLVDELVAEGLLSVGELDRLAVPRKTLVHRRRLGRLSPEQSDRLLRLLRVIAHAHTAFGAADKAARWLRRPTRALAGSTPLDLLDTDIGTLRVETLLGRIEHGIAA
jgi:putative toxin-antitoxin system antitoxin component (TIGR02293 family)